MALRDYQWEVIEPALEGKNIIIWLPTGAGKTRAAAYICKRHLESPGKNKVAVLVNTVPLVDQHLKNEFSPMQNHFRVTAISGDSSLKAFFGEEVKKHDLIICTAQILQNALSSQEEEMHVELTDFSLLVIDECHHTHKESTYNKIMENYLVCKLKGQRNLPQIVGLTASLGTGGATSFTGAKDHILQICANLDTEQIMSSEKYKSYLLEHVPQPKKQYDLLDGRAQDLFGAKLKEIMSEMHTYMNVPGLPTDFGSQIFEQRIMELQKEGAENFCRKTRVCAVHLRKYNDALLIHDTVRMIDAFNTLDEFYQLETAMKALQDPTERYLVQIFDRNRECLLNLARDGTNENPKLSKLQEVLQDQFQALKSSRGIVFTRTRQSAHALHQWIKNNQVLCDLEIKAAVLTGAGYGSQTKHMTQHEQQDVIHLFRNGKLNLLFSTSVAEEGLDIPECNIVVCYGLMTNEIAMIQARGRARAPNSICSVLAKANSKEMVRERLNETLEALMKRAIAWVQQMPQREYQLKIAQLQSDAVVSCKIRDAEREQRRQQHNPDLVRFYCINCNEAVCHGNDLRTVEKMHHININPNFRLYYRVSPDHVVIPREFKDWKPGSSISCNKCGQAWGMEMLYKSIALPMLAIKNFVVESPEGRHTHKKWNKVTFAIQEFDFTEYCNSNPEMLD